MRARTVIFVAAWAGLVAGSVNTLWAMAQWLAGAVVFADTPYLWMAPLATMLLFLTLSLPVAAVAAVRRSGVPPRLVVWSFTVLAIAAALLPVRLLHPYALLALAAGVAAVVARARITPAWSRRAIAGGLILVVLPALVVAAVMNLPSRRSQARMPGEGAPNVLLLILDTVRADALSIYGSARPTSPRLDALAREATLFRWALAPSSWTLPSHASFFTGFRPSELSPRWSRRLDNEKATLAEVLSEAGWRTGGFVGNYVYGSWGSGLTRGFETYRATPVTRRQLQLSLTFAQIPLVRRVWARISGRELGATRGGLRYPFELKRDRYGAGDLLRAFHAWRREERAKPFFAFVNLFEAHETGMVPERWLRLYDGGKTARDRYHGIVAWEDSVVGALLDTLAVDKILDRTLLIVSADHGEMFGGHDVISHGNSLYLGVQRVPLIVRFPGSAEVGREIDRPVSLQDLPATVLNALGLPPSLPGSPWPLQPADSPSPPVLGEVEQSNPGLRAPALFGPLRSLTAEGWRCILNADSSMEVYAYREDPEEERDLAATPAGRSFADDCRARFTQIPFGYRMRSGRGS